MIAVKLYILNNNGNISKSRFDMEYIQDLEAKEINLMIFAFLIYFYLNIFFRKIDLSSLLSIYYWSKFFCNFFLVQRASVSLEDILRKL